MQVTWSGSTAGNVKVGYLLGTLQMVSTFIDTLKFFVAASNIFFMECVGR